MAVSNPIDAEMIFVDTSPSMREPRIATLIPAYNEELVLEGTVSALLAAGAELSDVYIVDDRSTDRTAEIARELGVNIYTVPKNGGKAKAQVAALEHFSLLERYDWLVFLDGDTKIDRKFFVEMRNAIAKDPTVALYVGQVMSVRNDHLFSASRAFDYTYGHDIAKAGQSNFNVIFVSPGCASMYRSDILKKLYIDHLTLAEDMDLTMQVHQHGERVVYVPKAIVHTQDPSTFRDYHKQVLRWYRGFWQVVKKHRVFGLQKKKRVDWYMMILAFDAIVCNRALWLLLLLAFAPTMIPWALSIDLALASLICLYVAVKIRRFDVFWKFPLYYWIGYLNLYAYTRSFFEIIILRKTLLDWNKVKRYNFDNPSSTVHGALK